MLNGSETLVTIFGGTGFVGRYVCEYLLKAGVRLRVACRDPREAYFLQPLAGIGQWAPVRADVGKANSVAQAVAGADAVINLIGAFKNMQALHVAGPRAIAEAATANRATSLVHVSAIGADANSSSDYGRTKGEGEAAVRTAFASATIIRPSIVFGPEDDFTNRFATLAKLPILPVLAPATRFQPVYVRDLAQAIAAAALDPATHGGKTFEIGGPQTLSMIELNRLIADLAGQSPDIVALPAIAGSAMASLGFLPGAPLTEDQWKMLQRDNVAARGTPGLDAFGIEPTPIAAVADEWLARYRGGSRFQGRRATASPVT
ncbi:MAG: complex I NDUFA9 subunit family protein [Sphingomicrobium sp.]